LRAGANGGKRNAARAEEADAEDEEDYGDDEEKALRAFNRRYAVIITSGGVKILREPDRDDPNGDVQFLSQNDVALFERNNVVWIGDKKKGKSQKLEVFKLWLEWEKRRTYKNVVFLPGEATPPHIYNLFRGWAVDPIKGDWSMLRTHIFENICEIRRAPVRLVHDVARPHRSAADAQARLDAGDHRSEGNR
jgi:hypothetical protein